MVDAKFVEIKLRFTLHSAQVERKILYFLIDSSNESIESNVVPVLLT